VRTLIIAALVILASAVALPAAAQPGHGGCPPGQAKKGNCGPGEAFVPPGLAKKKWAVGHPLPPGVVYYAVPAARYATYGPPPRGHQYVQVDDDVLLMDQATRMIVNVVLGR
jgi:hypothetical protein